MALHQSFVLDKAFDTATGIFDFAPWAQATALTGAARAITFTDEERARLEAFLDTRPSPAPKVEARIDFDRHLCKLKTVRHFSCWLQLSAAGQTLRWSCCCSCNCSRPVANSLNPADDEIPPEGVRVEDTGTR
jgi:hypothetical protein